MLLASIFQLQTFHTDMRVAVVFKLKLFHANYINPSLLIGTEKMY